MRAAKENGEIAECRFVLPSLQIRIHLFFASAMRSLASALSERRAARPEISL